LRRPGLRGRVAIALVVTAAVALAVAALALLPPLERKLRTQEIRDLVSAADQSRSSFSELDSTNPRILVPRLKRRVRRVAAVTGARVALLDSNGRIVVNTDPDAPDAFRDVFAALQTDRAVRRIVSRHSTPEARVALRVLVEGKPYVLALRKPLNEPRSAAQEVRRAFTTAALAALAVALLAAGLFAATVGRRVRALRDAVFRFGIAARPEDLPDDRAADEVGDLSRAFVQMASRVRQEEEVRREFVSTASHELRTPLMALEGRLELLAGELSRPEPELVDGRRQLTEAREQAHRLSRLASDLLDLSRLDAEVALRRESVDMPELVRAVAAEFAGRAAADGRELELELKPVHALADPSATARIARVLVDNALRYSPAGTPVKLALEAGSGAVLLHVTDAGPGVPEASRERIFERFARVSGPHQPSGFGLGLAIARELSERMEGTLTLSQNGDAGSTFSLRLPADPGVS
jgi:signal transduction histidine kinase